MIFDVWSYVPTHPKSKYHYDKQTEAFLLGRERALLNIGNGEWLEKGYKEYREACEEEPGPKVEALFYGYKEVYDKIKAEEKK